MTKQDYQIVKTALKNAGQGHLKCEHIFDRKIYVQCSSDNQLFKLWDIIEAAGIKPSDIDFAQEWA